MPSKPRSELEIWDWPLPSEPYLPGRMKRPGDDDDVHRVARSAPSPTVAAEWRGNPAYRGGLRLYAHGYFWEAHEMWEPVWMAAAPNSAERALLQGLIQLANAGLKLRMEQIRAARRVAIIARGHVAEAMVADSCMGIDVPELVARMDRFVTAFDEDAEPTVPTLPVDSYPAR